MSIHWQAPAADLRPLVRCFWWMDLSSGGHAQVLRIASDGHPEILFQEGEPPVCLFSGSERQFALSHCMTGIFARHVQLRVRGRVRMFFVKLQPWALAMILRERAKGLIEQQLEIPVLKQRSLLHPGDFWAEGGEVAGMIQLCENWLRNRVKSIVIDPALGAATHWIMQHKGICQVGDLETALDKSRRRIEQLFAEYIGLSPKIFARVVRIRSVCESMLKGNFQMQDLVFHYGYFDQAHFIRDFKDLMGLSPGGYMRRMAGKKSLYEFPD